MTPSQEAREGYPLLPEPAMEDVPSELWGQNVTYPALYTAEQMRSYVDADRKARQQEALDARRLNDAERLHAAVRTVCGQAGEESEAFVEWLCSGGFAEMVLAYFTSPAAETARFRFRAAENDAVESQSRNIDSARDPMNTSDSAAPPQGASSLLHEPASMRTIVNCALVNLRFAEELARSFDEHGMLHHGIETAIWSLKELLTASPLPAPQGASSLSDRDLIDRFDI